MDRVRSIIAQQKKEKEYLLSRRYVPRDRLDFASRFVDDELIKVITGPRRAGKSVFCFLLLGNREYAYLNFDDENLLKIADTDALLRGITEVYGRSRMLFFDEIQNLKNWELFAGKLKRRGMNLVLTGSNSRLLSRELSSALTGRHVALEILPFSFREFLAARGVAHKGLDLSLPEEAGGVLHQLQDYVSIGGYPEVVTGGIEPAMYLGTLFDSTLLRDVVRRYSIRFPQKIYDLSLYLLSNTAAEFSFTRLKNVLAFNSVATLQNYVRYLEEAYLISVLNRFSFKIQEQVKSPKKVYSIDNGFLQVKAFHLSPNHGRLMENVVFQELLRRGNHPNHTLFFYRTRNQKEVDFVVKEGMKIRTLIQVCYRMTDVSERRETGALIEAAEELSCSDMMMITWDTEGERHAGGRKVRLVPLWKWLLAE